MSRYMLQKSVVMVGMMGAGKTAVGTALAHLIGVPFLDSDSQIVAAADLSIAEIFETYGEDFFREKESLVLKRLLAGTPAVLSTGGGAWLRDENRALVARLGLSVWLKADPQLLWSRVRHKDTRPLLRVANPRARLFELLAARTPFYREADLEVEAGPNLSVQDMADKVRKALLAHPSGVLRKVATEKGKAHD